MEASYLRLILLTIGGLILLLLLWDMWRRKHRLKASAASDELPKLTEVETFIRQEPQLSPMIGADPLVDGFTIAQESDDLPLTPIVIPAAKLSSNRSSIQSRPLAINTANAIPRSSVEGVNRGKPNLFGIKKQDALDDETIDPLFDKKTSLYDQMRHQAPEVLDEEHESEFAENLIVINILPRPGRRFVGYELLQGILSAGLRFGYMNLFHRHKDSHGQGPILFSLATVNAPGTFDMNTIGGLSCNGLSLFLQLPTEQNSLTIFDLMLNTARCLADDLNGELWYGRQKPFTEQHVEYYKRRILAFKPQEEL